MILMIPRATRSQHHSEYHSEAPPSTHIFQLLHSPPLLASIILVVLLQLVHLRDVWKRQGESRAVHNAAAPRVFDLEDIKGEEDIVTVAALPSFPPSCIRILDRGSLSVHAP